MTFSYINIRYKAILFSQLKSMVQLEMGILEFRIFRIRILKDSNPKSQFISNSWNRK